MSVKKEIFKTIGDHLMATLVNLPDGLPDLKWFDKQMGQFDQPETAFSLPLPAVLFEYGPISWQTTGTNNQKGDGNIKVTVYFENYADSFTGSINQELALQFFDFTECVHKALQGFGIEDKISALSRVGDAEDIAQDMIITSSLEYGTTIFDSSSTINYIDVDPDLSVKYKKTTSRPKTIVDIPTFLVKSN